MQTVKFKGHPEKGEDGKINLVGLNFGRHGWIEPNQVLVLTDGEWQSIKDNADKRFVTTNTEAPDTTQNRHETVLAVELDAMSNEQLWKYIEELRADGKEITVDKRAPKFELRAAIDKALAEPIPATEPAAPPTE